MKRLGVHAVFAVLFTLATSAARGENPKNEMLRSAICEGKDATGFSAFIEALVLIKGRYVNVKQVSDGKLIDSALQGLIEALDDPYAAYTTPEEMAREAAESGIENGVGALLGVRDKRVIVIGVSPKSYAAEAGLKTGDIVLDIDGVSIAGRSLKEVEALVSGRPRTFVSVYVERPKELLKRRLSMFRTTTQAPMLDYEEKVLPSGRRIAVLKLYNFSEASSELFTMAATFALQSRVRGIVLDLRDNGGGVIRNLMEVVGWFLKNGTIVNLQDTGEITAKIRAHDGNAKFANTPVVLVTNKGSASASEVLAGALRDNLGVKLIGDTTYGKGTMQLFKSLSNGGEIKFTVAYWRTPNGTKINGVGLTPDFTVGMAVADEAQGSKRDPQLMKALEVLESEIAAKAR